MSISETIIIPTAGLGSRMGNLTKNLNKALLPYLNKPVISHIIDCFPGDNRFIIPLGYLGKQVKDYLLTAYPDKHFEFLEIDDWYSENSGTGITLLKCGELVSSPFWYVPCDTYMQTLPIVQANEGEDLYFVKDVPKAMSHHYTMIEIDSLYKIKQITFKQTAPEDWKAFTGLMYISNYQDFFYRLENLNSTEFIKLIEEGDQAALLPTWLDFGNPDIYQTALSKSQKFDFTKKDEITYILENRVVKWWVDESIPIKKHLKTTFNKNVFPDNCTQSGNFLGYDFCEGETLYSFNNPVMFNELLSWLKNNVWVESKTDIKKQSLEFYKNKSLLRINKFLEKYPTLPSVNFVDGVAVKDYKFYLNNIKWDRLADTALAVFTHGDLQFDNIIITKKGEFKIIDWRHEFAGLVMEGDLYYDLAKLMGGLIINYADIKNHNFNIEMEHNVATLSIPNVDHIEVYQEKLKQFILDNKLDYQKVKTLVPIIFWNMAPLHSAPFDIFLWYLGIKLFQELENDV